jgi:hypothetical protein
MKQQNMSYACVAAANTPRPDEVVKQPSPPLLVPLHRSKPKVKIMKQDVPYIPKMEEFDSEDKHNNIKEETHPSSSTTSLESNVETESKKPIPRKKILNAQDTVLPGPDMKAVNLAKLLDKCELIFCKIYGLNGHKKCMPREILPKWISQYGVSLRNFCHLLYGDLCNDKLAKWRSQVQNYQTQSGIEKMNQQALLQLFELPFANFDGNSINVKQLEDGEPVTAKNSIKILPLPKEVTPTTTKATRSYSHVPPPSSTTTVSIQPPSPPISITTPVPQPPPPTTGRSARSSLVAFSSENQSSSLEPSANISNSDSKKKFTTLQEIEELLKQAKFNYLRMEKEGVVSIIFSDKMMENLLEDYRRQSYECGYDSLFTREHLNGTIRDRCGLDDYVITSEPEEQHDPKEKKKLIDQTGMAGRAAATNFCKPIQQHHYRFPNSVLSLMQPTPHQTNQQYQSSYASYPSVVTQSQTGYQHLYPPIPLLPKYATIQQAAHSSAPMNFYYQNYNENLRSPQSVPYFHQVCLPETETNLYQQSHDVPGWFQEEPEQDMSTTHAEVDTHHYPLNSPYYNKNRDC